MGTLVSLFPFLLLSAFPYLAWPLVWLVSLLPSSASPCSFPFVQILFDNTARLYKIPNRIPKKKLKEISFVSDITTLRNHIAAVSWRRFSSCRGCG